MSEVDHRHQAEPGFLDWEVYRNALPFFHHRLPVLNDLLTQWGRYHVRKIRRTETHCRDQAGLKVKSSFLESQRRWRWTKHIMNSVVATCHLCNVRSTEHCYIITEALEFCQIMLFRPAENNRFKISIILPGYFGMKSS